MSDFVVINTSYNLKNVWASGIPPPWNLLFYMSLNIFLANSKRKTHLQINIFPTPCCIPLCPLLPASSPLPPPPCCVPCIPLCVQKNSYLSHDLTCKTMMDGLVCSPPQMAPLLCWRSPNLCDMHWTLNYIMIRTGQIKLEIMTVKVISIDYVLLSSVLQMMWSTIKVITSSHPTFQAISDLCKSVFRALLLNYKMLSFW